MVFDTTRGLGVLPTPQLVRSTVLLHACASRAVVLAGCALLRAAVQRPDSLGRPALLAARHTFFRQFVAGERLADVETVAARLSASGVRCIVDHSTEELEHTAVRRDLSPEAATAAQTRTRSQARTRDQTRARRGATTSTPSSSSSVGCARRSAACRPTLHPLCTLSVPPPPPLPPPPPPPPLPPPQRVPPFGHARELRLRVVTYVSPLQMRESCAFVPIKLTALASPRILERLTEGERMVRAARGEAARGTTTHSGSSSSSAAASASSSSSAAKGEGCEPPSLEQATAAAQLSPEESRELEEGMAGLRALCDGAHAW